MLTKSLPSSVTSYDLLKTFAVITMIIDHVGAYFFPEDMWWRAIGRMSFPAWLFLVGYARGRDLSPALWGGAIILTAANFIFGMPIFSLNILVAIICVRLLLDPLMVVLNKDNQKYFWPVVVVLIVLGLPSQIMFEYGSFAFLAAVFGYMVRNKERYDLSFISNYMVAMFVGYLFVQYISFGFSMPQLVVMAVGTFFVWYALLKFDGKPLPELNDKLYAPARGFLKFCGRRTLGIYVGHLLLFKCAALLMGIEGFGLFAWDWL